MHIFEHDLSQERPPHLLVILENQNCIAYPQQIRSIILVAIYFHNIVAAVVDDFPWLFA
jgi:hypothetical protein